MHHHRCYYYYYYYYYYRATASFTITVQDTTPPTLTVPQRIVVPAVSPFVGVATYTVTAEDNIDGAATLNENNDVTQGDDVGGDITISCVPLSGTPFLIGDNRVDCAAADAADNVGVA
jgi:hypothetical protein